MAIKLAKPTTQSSPYLYCEPPAKSVPQLPGVHVADAHQDRRADEGPPLSPEANFGIGNQHRAVQSLQRHVADMLFHGHRAAAST